MLTITRRDIEDAYSAASAAHRHVQGIKGKGESVVGSLLQTVEVNAGALAIGVACGRYGALHLQGSSIPLDLAGGVFLHGMAFFGLAGRYGEHLHNVADGVLAAFTTKAGIGIGTEMRSKAGLPPAMTVSGSGNPQPQHPNHGHHMHPHHAPPHQVGPAPHVGDEPLTEAELAAMAQSFR